MNRLRGRWSLVYVLWICTCVILFLAMRSRPDPSRRHGRILSGEAGERAVTLLRGQGPAWRDFEAVHVAYAGKGEGGPADRWIVLCDHDVRTSLHQAVVVELRAEDGTLIVVRKPVG